MFFSAFLFNCGCIRIFNTQISNLKQFKQFPNKKNKKTNIYMKKVILFGMVTYLYDLLNISFTISCYAYISCHTLVDLMSLFYKTNNQISNMHIYSIFTIYTYSPSNIVLLYLFVFNTIHISSYLNLYLLNIHIFYNRLPRG